jgi:hypothetical protein
MISCVFYAFLWLKESRAGRPFHNRPLIDNRFPPNTMKPVVEIHRGIAVRNDEPQLVAEFDVAAWMIEQQTPVFITRKFVDNAGDAEWLGAEWPVRGECFQAGIDNRFPPGLVNHRTKNA